MTLIEEVTESLDAEDFEATLEGEVLDVGVVDRDCAADDVTVTVIVGTDVFTGVPDIVDVLLMLLEAVPEDAADADRVGVGVKLVIAVDVEDARLESVAETEPDALDAVLAVFVAVLDVIEESVTLDVDVEDDDELSE